ncbi:hypothetical protein E4U03_11205 [Rothia nasimurium]|uniref:Uncharacterized protein n=1 Tax=Rothia nasimurium TaxID=85336 RepID=A0A4Y9F353_9MICC|nr:hypothetical protein [Rothia nasimurium]MBF0809166.1 hypothetical protein [Rothia nasimurium]TFU20555.1 hypothetical protein E4U03_11205 [Rothia nasimurium]
MAVATTFWYTRREPVFRDTEFNTEYGRDVVARVTADAEAGIPTGVKPALAHLDPLSLRNELGAIQMNGTQVASQPRLHLIDYGPSQSTVGANRAGRIAVRKLHQLLTR